jgi:hypothetical protein
MKQLLVYQALWGMERLAGVDLENDLPGALERVFGAGFDGVGFSLTREERAEIVARQVREHGKSFEVIGFVRVPEDLARLVDFAQALEAHHLTIQIMTRVARVAEAVRLLTQLEAISARAAIPVYYETHRGRLTNDLLFTLRVLDELPTLRLTGDLSHYVLAHEMSQPVPEADLERMARILDHCWAFHGRIASSHQIQVSPSAPQHAAWVRQFRSWWRYGFQSWCARADADAQLTFMTEFGPPHYAITAADGQELSDRWNDALMLKDIAREAWAEATSA